MQQNSSLDQYEINQSQPSSDNDNKQPFDEQVDDLIMSLTEFIDLIRTGSP